MQSIILCIGVQIRTAGRRPRAYRQYRAALYGAVQYSRNRFKWRFNNAIGVWRFNESDAVADAKMAAAENDIELLPGVHGGENVSDTLIKPQASDGINPVQQF